MTTPSPAASPSDDGGRLSARLLPAIAAAVVVCTVAAISLFTGAWIGERTVEMIPAISITEAVIDEGTIRLTLTSRASYPLRAEYGFALFAPDGRKLYESEPIDAGQIPAYAVQTVAVTWPSDVPIGDVRLTTWAREVVLYLDRVGAIAPVLVESSAIVRRAPMSIERIIILFTPGGETTIGAALRLTGTTEQPIRLRYALSVTRIEAQEDGAFLPMEQAWRGEFTALTLLPGDDQQIDETIRLPLPSGLYAVTLWVQRETDEPGTFEHFAQFTSPETFTVP